MMLAWSVLVLGQESAQTSSDYRTVGLSTIPILYYVYYAYDVIAVRLSLVFSVCVF